MSKGNSESPEARIARIKQEASAWVIKQSYDFRPEDQDAFFEWLAADSEHAEAYQQRQETWNRLDVLADWRPEHSFMPNPDLLEGNQRVRRSKLKLLTWALASAAVLTLGCFLWFTVFEDAFSDPGKLSSSEFARGYERHVLEDGSIVELNLGSQASIDFSQDLRLVMLESGEAHFTIAKNAGRPFIVRANGVAVEAVGTIFNVQIRDDSVDVLVTEGRVHVRADAFEGPGSSNSPEDDSVQELTSGQQTVIELGKTSSKPQVLELSESELEEKLTWLKQVIHFDAAALSEIVFEFNRRNYRKIVIEDPSIEDTQLSVTIRPNNVDDFVELLELTANIRAERIGDSVITIRSK
ncbi:MAG: DUF4880 domain-containing protein [Opitutae bacterium]|nr:DUF4880 domain-containing protein [Opitutae bacterium]MBC9890545.1 DUF4880 domain-containing protein [Opitutae bacterium]